MHAPPASGSSRKWCAGARWWRRPASRPIESNFVGDGMTMTRRALLRLAGSAVVAPAVPALAQEWPTRPIKIMVGTVAGGSPDIISRIVGDKLGEKLGQSFVIEN